MKVLSSLLLFFLPWVVRRALLSKLYGYQIDRTARIGFSWVFPKTLYMGPNSRIGSFSVFRNVDNVSLSESSSIGSWNWITGFPTANKVHFQHVLNRKTSLQLAEHSAVTGRHIIDCTAPITIGAFATVAGYRSQLISHSVDPHTCRQDCAPIHIGAYSFVGTGVIVLGGATVPDRSIIGAGSVVLKGLKESDWLYGGVPCKAVRRLGDLPYFNRKTGAVK